MSGDILKCVVLEHVHGHLEVLILENGKTPKDMVMEDTSGRTVISTKESGMLGAGSYNTLDSD